MTFAIWKLLSLRTKFLYNNKSLLSFQPWFNKIELVGYFLLNKKTYYKLNYFLPRNLKTACKKN